MWIISDLTSCSPQSSYQVKRFNNWIILLIKTPLQELRNHGGHNIRSVQVQMMATLDLTVTKLWVVVPEVLEEPIVVLVCHVPLRVSALYEKVGTCHLAPILLGDFLHHVEGSGYSQPEVCRPGEATLNLPQPPDHECLHSLLADAAPAVHDLLGLEGAVTGLLESVDWCYGIIQ